MRIPKVLACIAIISCAPGDGHPGADGGGDEQRPPARAPIVDEQPVDDEPDVPGVPEDACSDESGCGCQRDTFETPIAGAVDFLLVIDNSGSLMEEQEAIARNFDALLGSAVLRGVDWHVAVTTTGMTPYKGGWSDCPGGVDGGEAGRFFPVDRSRERVLTPATPDVRAAFAGNVRPGVCHWWEEGLEAARRALSPPLVDGENAGFLRDDAELHVLFVSDEDDWSGASDSADPPNARTPVEEYVGFFRGLKAGTGRHVSTSAIIGLPGCSTAPSVGTRYMDLVNALEGTVVDICEPDWSTMLTRIGAEAFAREIELPLVRAPVPGTIEVRIDGVPVPALGAFGEQQWDFEPFRGDNGAVVLPRSFPVAGGARVEVTYVVHCAEAPPQ